MMDFVDNTSAARQEKSGRRDGESRRRALHAVIEIDHFYDSLLHFRRILILLFAVVCMTLQIITAFVRVDAR